jgi:NTP pyrophosphatase (non-canonical NTP hydrolase)
MVEHMTNPSEIQQSVASWAAQYWDGEYWPPLANLARLTEETGELARAINQQYGAKRIKSAADVSDIEEELGDLLFVIGCLANSTGADLQRGFETALAKYLIRDENGPEFAPED